MATLRVVEPARRKQVEGMCVTRALEPGFSKNPFMVGRIAVLRDSLVLTPAPVIVPLPGQKTMQGWFS
jgi:hypothetical protein